MTDFKNYLKLSLLPMKAVLSFLLMFVGFELMAQEHPGIILGSVLDEKSKALEGATVQLTPFADSLQPRTVLTDNNGAFRIAQIPFGYYKLRVSYVGFRPLTLDSIYFRKERYDFNLNDVVLKAAGDSAQMEEIIIYAEKPLIQNKDGNIIFNAGESALSAGSNASELLTNVPLVTKDPSGKIMVRGKEPKILIDDKPVELNLQQLQDLLESMPGSSVEKIEVMTNPPPQYANEQGGVINIVTKKGSIGRSGRISVYGGTRGETGINGSYNYRKQGFSINVNTGLGYNNFRGEGYSRRQNIYKDSTNFFNTENSYHNNNLRPSLRANMNYDINKFHALNLTLQYNQNEFTNENTTTYTNINRNEETYRLSERDIRSTGESYNPNLGLSYTIKTKKLGESFRIISDLNYSSSENNRRFYQQFFFPDHTPNGVDSTQEQLYESKSRGTNTRLSYELPFSKSRTYVSLGAFMNRSRSDVDVNASYYKKADSSWATLDALTNEFRFRQKVMNLRGSVKQVIKDNFSATIGLNAEKTNIHFDLFKTGGEAENGYWSFLPFATLNRNWKEVLNLTFSYRRTIRRPGIGELNPTVDFSDPYNIRFGNPDLLPSLAHNFDLVLGKTNKSFYVNLGMGYNIVEDIYNQVRTLKGGGVTEITWQNISGKTEYELSTWSGYTVGKNWKLNLSASYSYNKYGSFEKTVRKFRDGGSLSSNFNTNYIFKELYTATGSFTFNRFANPQGRVNSSLSMNLALQAKLLDKKLTVTLNAIDPFFQQRNRTFTYGTNFNLESYSSTRTRNFRFTVGYNLSKSPKKKPGGSKPAAKQPKVNAAKKPSM